MKPEVSIIIVSYNTKALLLQTIKSIKAKRPFEIIVVDNGSKDGSQAAIITKYPDIQLISLSENKGFGAANNLAATKAQGRYLLFLNSDVEVQAGAVDTMAGYLSNHPKAGIVGPKLILADGSYDWAGHRGKPTLWNALWYFAGIAKFFSKSRLFAGYHRSFEDMDRIHHVPVVSGAAMMMARKDFERLGGFDEQFFMYAEDIDLCVRMETLEKHTVYLPTATVLHFKGQSGTKHRDRKKQRQTKDYFYQTMKQYFRKHYPHYPRPVWWLVDFAVNLVARLR